MSVTALKLIEMKEDRKLYVTDKATEYLKNFPGPLKVITWWGDGRTGKTCNIQKIIEKVAGVAPEGVEIVDMRDDVYKVGSSLTPVTNGVDGVFVPASQIQGKSGEAGTYLFIDLEGTNNPFAQGNPIELQVMALMSTSVLILFDRGNASLNSVMGLATACTEVIQRYFAEDSRNIISLKPSWLWMLNATNLVDSIDDPLEMLLADNDNPQATALREQLDNCFEKRGFECLPDYAHADQYASKLDDEIKWIFDNLGELKLGELPLSGADYCYLITEACQNLNENGVIRLEPAFLAIARERLVQIRTAEFERFVEGLPDVSRYKASLGNDLRKKKKNSLQNFDSEAEPIKKSAGAESIYNEERANFESALDDKIQHLEDVNSQAKKTMCRTCTACCGGICGSMCACCC